MRKIPDDAVDHATVQVFDHSNDGEAPYYIINPTDRGFGAMPDLVIDRIRVSGVFEHFDVPDDETVELGDVAWGDDGLPRRLECTNGVVVTWDAVGPTVEK